VRGEERGIDLGDGVHIKKKRPKLSVLLELRYNSGPLFFRVGLCKWFLEASIWRLQLELL
jgi:hypothetical protein